MKVETDLVRADSASFAGRRRPDALHSSRSFAHVFRDAVAAAERSGTPSVSRISENSEAARALALQAEIYQQAERVEIVSKLVDHAVSAVKTLLQTRF